MPGAAWITVEDLLAHTSGLYSFQADPALRAEPGYKSIELMPYPIDGLDWVNCSYDSPHGKIVSNWKRSGSKFEWTVEIPAGTTATAYVPGPDSSRTPKPLLPGRHHFVTEL